MSSRRTGLAAALALLGAALASVFLLAALPGRPPTPSQRADHLESLVRCPTCSTVSVAQANDPFSVLMRSQIERLVREGKSDGEVLQFLVARYGPSILLDPPRRSIGISWAVLAALGACGGALALWLPRKAWQARREAQGGEEPAMPARSRGAMRRLLAVGATAFICAGLSYLGYSISEAASSPRHLSLQALASRADLARELAANGYPDQALRIDEEILRSDPSNEVALADAGFLSAQRAFLQRRERGIEEGLAMCLKASRVDPADPIPHLYAGEIYLDLMAQPRRAAEQFAVFLRLKPPAEAIQRAMPEIRLAFKEAGWPLPSSGADSRS
jgi:cytochrome c-type biogenesis protein CcmH